MEAPTIATWHLRGPVQSMTSRISEWDATTQAWRLAHRQTQITFDQGGRATEIDQSAREGSVNRSRYQYDARGRLIAVEAGALANPSWITRHSYDEHDRLIQVDRVAATGVTEALETCTYDVEGRRTSVERLPHGLDGYGVRGSDCAYAAPGAKTQTTYYDEHGRTVMSIFHDAENRVVRRVKFDRDAEGRTLVEESSIGERLPFAEPALADVAAEDREKMLALVRQVFDLMTTTFAYDEKGRIIERITTMGRLAHDRHLFQYDEHDNPVSEVSDEHSREMGVEEDGVVQARNERRRWHETRFTYVYDGRGNWTERTVSWRQHAAASFTPSNVEQRAIKYY